MIRQQYISCINRIPNAQRSHPLEYRRTPHSPRGTPLKCIVASLAEEKRRILYIRRTIMFYFLWPFFFSRFGCHSVGPCLFSRENENDTSTIADFRRRNKRTRGIYTQFVDGMRVARDVEGWGRCATAFLDECEENCVIGR